MRTPEQRLAELGLDLAAPPTAVAAHQPYVAVGTSVHVSGQIAIRGGELVARGRLGADVDVPTGKECARVCALNVLAQLRAAAGGSLDHVRRLVKVNVGRGGVIDEAALIHGLQAGQPAGAVLDVFATEPLPADSPLWQLPNVLISPHTASLSHHENERIIGLFVENLTRYLRGEELLGRVRPALLH